MKATKIESCITWFKKRIEEFKVSGGTYGYYNIAKILSDKEIEKIQRFCEKSNCINFLTIINGVNPLRPQRTFGGFPEFVRNNTQYHFIFPSENCFIFVSSMIYSNTVKPPLVPYTPEDMSLYLNLVEEEYQEYLYAKKSFLESVTNIANEAEAELIIKEFTNEE